MEAWVKDFEGVLDRAEQTLRKKGPIHNSHKKRDQNLIESFKEGGPSGFIKEMKRLIIVRGTPDISGKKKVSTGVYHFRSIPDLYRCYLYVDDEMSFADFSVLVIENMLGGYCGDAEKMVYDNYKANLKELEDQYNEKYYTYETIGVNRITFKNLLKYFMYRYHSVVYHY